MSLVARVTFVERCDLDCLRLLIPSQGSGGGVTGRGCSSVGRASNWHAAEAGSIPRAARDFSPTVKFQCRLFYGVRTVLVCDRML